MIAEGLVGLATIVPDAKVVWLPLMRSLFTNLVRWAGKSVARRREWL